MMETEKDIRDEKEPLPEEDAAQEKEKKAARRKEILEWVRTFIFAIAIAILIRTFVFEMVSVHQSSMYPTLKDGENVGIFKLAYTVSPPDRGDIVIIKVSEEKNYVKRVIALPGEKIEIADSTVYIDGEPLDEEYLPEELVYDDYGPIVIPEGCFFAMGDNRPTSIDSRALGCFDEEDLIGKVIIRFVPFRLF